MQQENGKGLSISVRSFVTAIGIIFLLMTLAYGLTFLIPGGAYARVADAGGNLIIDTAAAFTYTDGGKARLYSPAIARNQAALQETESLLGRVYRGSIAMLVSTLADGRGLSQADIDELSAVLEKAKEEQA